MAKIIAKDKKTGGFDAETTAENLVKTLTDCYDQLIEFGGTTTVKVGKDKKYDKEIAVNTFKVPPSVKKKLILTADYVKSMFQSEKKGGVGRKVMVDDTILEKIYVDYRQAHPERPLPIVYTAVANAYNEEVNFVKPIAATYVPAMAKKKGWENLVEMPKNETITADDVETVNA